MISSSLTLNRPLMVSSQLILNPVTSNLKHPPTLLRSLTLSLRPTRLPILITRLRLRNPMKLPSLSTKLPLRSTTRHPSLNTRLQPNTTRHPSLITRLQPNTTRLQLHTTRHPSLNIRLQPHYQAPAQHYEAPAP